MSACWYCFSMSALAEVNTKLLEEVWVGPFPCCVSFQKFFSIESHSYLFLIMPMSIQVVFFTLLFIVLKRSHRVF